MSSKRSEPDLFHDPDLNYDLDYERRDRNTNSSELVTGVVTQLHGNKFGMISNRIFFHSSDVVGGSLNLGSSVVAEVEAVGNGFPFALSATKVQIVTNMMPTSPQAHLPSSGARIRQDNPGYGHENLVREPGSALEGQGYPVRYYEDEELTQFDNFGWRPTPAPDSQHRILRHDPQHQQFHPLPPGGSQSFAKRQKTRSPSPPERKVPNSRPPLNPDYKICLNCYQQGHPAKLCTFPKADEATAKEYMKALPNSKLRKTHKRRIKRTNAKLSSNQ